MLADLAEKEMAYILSDLANIGTQAALIAGFAMVVMVEIALPDRINFLLLVLYGATSASVVGLMLLAMLNCTMMLIAILKYDCVNRPIPYDQFWQTRCEGDWRFAYQCFSLGVPMRGSRCLLCLVSRTCVRTLGSWSCSRRSGGSSSRSTARTRATRTTGRPCPRRSSRSSTIVDETHFSFFP